VRIEADDRSGREWLFRYCARRPLALDGLRELDPEHLLYESTKPGGTGPLRLTPLQLLDRPRHVGAATAHPSSLLLRRAGASGRSWEISAASPNGSSWPVAGIAAIRPGGRCVAQSCQRGLKGSKGPRSGQPAPRFLWA